MVKYADRAFLSVNGAELIDLQRASLKQNLNAKAVNSMTRTRFNRGFVQGNTDIDLDFEIAVDNSLASPKLESIDFANASIACNFQVGADLYIAHDLFIKEVSNDAGGIGDEVKKSFRMGALSVTDAVGNSILFNLATA